MLSKDAMTKMEPECPHCGEDIELNLPVSDITEEKIPKALCPKCNREVKMVDILLSDDITDEELTRVVLRMDEKMASEGITPPARLFQLPPRLAGSRFGLIYSIGGRDIPEILQRIQKIHEAYYRPKDTAVEGVHGGVYMFRDIPALIRIPAIVGYVRIKPFDHNDLSCRQLEWLCSFPEHVEGYLSTFSDIFDFAGCMAPFGDCTPPTKDLALAYMKNAAFHLQSATSALCAAFDGRGAIQSSLIGAELALKASLIEKSVSEDTLKKEYGHNRSKLIEKFGTLYVSHEIIPMIEMSKTLPMLIPNRYSPEQPNQRETGIILMNCQYIAGAVARAVGGHSFTHCGYPI